MVKSKKSAYDGARGNYDSTTALVSSFLGNHKTVFSFNAWADRAY
jgi:hypothetical protein